jgi:diguanylate cyclase (GGDEF)-like protein
VNAHSESPAKNKKIILLIDDSITSRTAVSSVLAQNDYEVVQAEDGEEGIILFRQYKPDLVLLDVIMPGMDGYKVCEKLRIICTESIEAMPIVMLTGKDDASSIEKAFSSGATDFITKPLNFKLLSQRIAYILRNSVNYQELKNKEEQLDRAQRIAKLGYWRMELPTQRVSLSDQCARMLGINMGHGCFSVDELISLVHPEDKEKVLTSIQQAVSNRSTYHLEHRLKLPDGTMLTVQQHGEYVRTSKLKGKDYMLGTMQDITELRTAQLEVDYQRYYDHITGLPNRRSFEIQLNHLVAITEVETITAIVFIALDNFSGLNESIGHEAADKVLIRISERLRELEGRGHYVSRFGGDRFAVLLRNITHIDHCQNYFENILEKIHVPIDYQGNEHHITASIGASLFPIESENGPELIQWAESAVLQAKHDGGDRGTLHTAERNQRAKKRLTLEQAMRKSIENEEFITYYQPQVSAHNCQIVGMEALVRWEHPELGLISPADFIPLAEETGLIIPIGEQVLKTACTDTRNWLDQGYSLVVGVNLSPLQFSQPNLLKIVEQVLTETRLPSEALELEVTEGMAMRDFEATLRTLNIMKEMHIKRSLDDFGTGYSSLSYLQRMPLSTLKIDQSFVRCIQCDGEDADGARCGSGAIAVTIINLSQNLGLHVIAEGVETRTQYEFLRGFGNLTLQGYYFGRPIPGEQFNKILSIGVPLPGVEK